MYNTFVLKMDIISTKIRILFFRVTCFLFLRLSLYLGSYVTRMLKHILVV